VTGQGAPDPREAVVAEALYAWIDPLRVMGTYVPRAAELRAAIAAAREDNGGAGDA
jgi:hypothetical protein